VILEEYNQYPYLRGSGEMGELTGIYNWESTYVGSMRDWPQSLHTAVGIVLQSAFPMLLFLGKDLIVFYNDAYSEILKSANRHPALGKRAEELWPENWKAVEPLLQKVYNEGESIHFRDQLIPIMRNGEMEDVYWTFKYSPYYSDKQEIAGIIVSCAETTNKVSNLKQLLQSKEELEFAIEATELGVWDVNPLKGTLKANLRLKEWFGLEPDEEVLLSSATDVIIEQDRQRVIDTINNSLKYESGGRYDIEYTILNPKTKTNRIVRAKGRTWFNDDKVAYRFNGTLQDVTEQVLSLKKTKQSEQRFRNLVDEAIVSTAVLTGPDMVLELANEAMLNIWGRDESILGKPLLDFMPELKDQPFPKILARVFETGEPFIANDAYVQLKRNGKIDEVYMDFSYKPLKNENDEITSILVMATDVTERVLSGVRLKQSEKNLRNTILKAPVAMAIFKGDHFITEIANDKMLELWGKDADEIIGKPTFEALPEIEKQGFKEILEDVYATGKSFSARGIPVNFNPKKSSENLYLNFVFEAYRDPDDNITGIIVVALDITDQVMARRKLEESEQRVRAIIESAPFPIGVYEGEELVISVANQTMMDIWGKGNDVVHKRYTDVLPEMEDQKVFAQLKHVYRTGIPFHAKNQRLELIVNGSPKYYYFHYSFTPLYDSSGKVYGVMNTGADVTDLNLAKQKVEQSEANFRNMILQAPVAMCILLGPDHIIDIANDLMVELWGKQREAMMGRPLWEALPDAAEQGLEQLLKWVYETGETFSASERPVELLRNGKTEIVYQNFVYEPYKSSEGKILGVLAISIDVTPQVIARRKIEEVVKERTAELELVNNNLENSNAELAQFAYITSHDLQEPIRKISIFTKMLESSFGELEERQAGYISKIKVSAERMTNLIKDVLLYSQLSKGQQPFEMVNLNKIVSDALTDFELVIEQNNATVTYEDLPMVEAIPLQMSQLFGNLISNSLKYAQAGVPPVLKITSSALPAAETGHFNSLDPKTEYYKIEFMDNGIGFEPEYADKIFHIFQRLHTKSEYSGTGIGLAMCKRIMENHNGDISAVSHKGKGAVFTIILPAKQS